MQLKTETERIDRGEHSTEELIAQAPLPAGVKLMEQRMKSGQQETSSESDSVVSSDSDCSDINIKNRKKQRDFNRFDLTKDKATKFSIRIDFEGDEKLGEPPYPLNIVDRNYLVTAFRYHN
jgi:hypothetical protein